MSISNKSLNEVTEEDLQDLIDGQEIETKNMDYKKNLPNLEIPKAKKEFLSDIASFANASGGDLIFGIEEKDGIPIDPLNGLAIPASEIDGLKLKLENIIRSRSNIDPRINGVSIQPIKLNNGNFAIIIRIPKSWASPHMVTLELKDHERFFSRNSAGKYALDVSEIRTAFDLTISMEERIRNFRVDRVGKIMAEETPAPLSKNPTVILHIIPIAALGLTRTYLEVSLLAESARGAGILPLIDGYSGYRYNLDGYLVYDKPAGESTAYVQIFRNGIIESVETKFVGGDRIFSGPLFDIHVRSGVCNYLSFERKVGIDPPYLIMLSLLGFYGSELIPQKSRFAVHHIIDRNPVLAPEVMFNDFGENLDEIIKPMLDSIWNAAGYDRSWSFDKDGKWIH